MGEPDSLVYDTLKPHIIRKKTGPAPPHFPSGIHHGYFNGKMVIVHDSASIEMLVNCGAFGFRKRFRYDLETQKIGDITVPREEQQEDDEAKDDEPLENNPFLSLNLQEAFYLSYGLGRLVVHNEDGDAGLNIDQLWTKCRELDKHFVDKYVVYHYYRSLGWALTGGHNYGVDFMLYEHGPAYSHSVYAVYISNIHTDTHSALKSWTFLIAKLRALAAVNKSLIAVEVVWPETPDLSTPGCLSGFTVREFALKNWFPESESLGGDEKGDTSASASGS